MSVNKIWITCFLILLVASSLPSRSLAAGPYFVKADATGANNGTSWANAFTDLQSALAVAQWSEEIWVAAGNYKPTSGTDRTKSFVMVAGAALYGGFAGTETARAQRDWKAHETILSGDIGVQGDTSDNSNHVVTGSLNAVLDGFTVKNGNAGNGSAGSGSGAGMINNSVSPTVANCTFSDNLAPNGFGGGGMYNNDASPTVTSCTFSNNTANGGGGMYNGGVGSPIITHCTFSGNTGNSGGGMYNQSCSPMVTNCTFIGNVTSSYGGGMYNNNTSPTVTNCTFSNNTANSGGGGMSNNYDTLVMKNCLFIGNSSSGHGGGMYNSNSSLTVTHCTFSKNMTSTYGGGMFSNNNSLTTANCIFWNNSATQGGSEVFGQAIIRYCDIRGSGGSVASWDTTLGTDGGGNIAADPLFVDSLHPTGPDGLWMTADDGLRLQANSHCINSGNPNDATATDIIGNPRNGAPDIGAYEYYGIPPVIMPIIDASIPDDQPYTGPTPELTTGTMPIIWTLVQGPTGITIAPGTGVVSWLAPTVSGSPSTIRIRATNAFGQAEVTWRLSVYHPGPPSTPVGNLEVTYHIKTPSTSPGGRPVLYTYDWTSDHGDHVTHGPTASTSDTLTEMNLVQNGETWTVRVTPTSGNNTGVAAFATIKFVDVRNSVWVWSIYR